MRIGTVASVALITLAVELTGFGFPSPVFGHDGPADHRHPHQHAGPAAAGRLFTTRDGARMVPLTREEDVFHFVVYGDRTGGNPAGLKVLQQAVADTNLLDPDLVMTVGDLIQGYNMTDEWMSQMRRYQSIMGKLSMPWYPVAGNHDVYWRGSVAPPPGHHERNYEEHFGPLWYSFGHKNAGFIVLYSDEGVSETNEKGFSEGRLQRMSSTQLDFLRGALAKHGERDHVFVFLHHPRWTGGGYRGGNWDEVHALLKEAGNVTAVFAGHIHHIRFDGPRDGIEYYTLATTGGHLSADMPGAGYLHHYNMVSVRPSGISVTAIPVGTVMDPKQFTPEFLAQVDAARTVRPIPLDGAIALEVDGSASGSVTFTLKNPCEHALDVTLRAAGRSWQSTLDHAHASIPPGKQHDFDIGWLRPAGLNSLSLPQLEMEVELLAESGRIAFPMRRVPVPLSPSSFPADYFTSGVNGYLTAGDEKSAIRINNSEFDLPDGPFTLEAWVRPRDNSGYTGMIAKTQGSEYALFSDEGVPQFDVHLDGRYITATAQTKLPIERWSHLAGVFDGQSVKLFVDGDEVGRKEASGSRTSNRLPLWLGADPGNAGEATRPFWGDLDEVRLSTGARYAGSFEPNRRHEPDSQTVLLFHLDRTIGPFVIDHSSSAAIGTLQNQRAIQKIP
ncbi:MAG: LamG-like jellyroll fold domain-containing protein [Planctomycetota bacterium]